MALDAFHIWVDLFTESWIRAETARVWRRLEEKKKKNGKSNAQRLFILFIAEIHDSCVQLGIE